MSTYRRTELIIEYGRSEAIEFANQIASNYEIDEIISPHLGLVMIKQRETAQNSLFYIGEVLVTETKVRYQKEVGIGLIKGDDFDFSRALAIIDLTYKMNWKEKADLENWLVALITMEKNVLAEKQASYLRTKVDFSTMNI